MTVFKLLRTTGRGETALHEAPATIGSEFIAKIVQRWLKEHRIKTIHIEPGSPWQNGLWKVSMAGSGTNA